MLDSHEFLVGLYAFSNFSLNHLRTFMLKPLKSKKLLSMSLIKFGKLEEQTLEVLMWRKTCAEYLMTLV